MRVMGPNTHWGHSFGRCLTITVSLAMLQQVFVHVIARRVVGNVFYFILNYSTVRTDAAPYANNCLYSWPYPIHLGTVSQESHHYGH